MVEIGHVIGYSSLMSKPGQPTKYKDTYPDAVYEYLTECKNEPIGKTRDDQDIPRLPVVLGSFFSISLPTFVNFVGLGKTSAPQFSIRTLLYGFCS